METNQSSRNQVVMHIQTERFFFSTYELIF